jgi:hypothetical protein
LISRITIEWAKLSKNINAASILISASDVFCNIFRMHMHNCTQENFGDDIIITVARKGYLCIKTKTVAKAGLMVTAECNYKWICYSYLEGNNLKARDTLDHAFHRID